MGGRDCRRAYIHRREQERGGRDCRKAYVHPGEQKRQDEDIVGGHKFIESK